MDMTGFLIFISTGAAAGWLAGLMMKKRGHALLVSIIIGAVGAMAAGFLFGLLEIIGLLLTALLGAAILLFLAWIITKSKNQS